MIDEENAQQMVGGLFQFAETTLVNELKNNRNVSPVIVLNDFTNQLHDAGLDRRALESLVPQGFDAVLAYVVEQLQPRRAEFSCFMLIFDPMDDAAQSAATVRVEHLLGNSAQCKAPFARKKNALRPEINRLRRRHGRCSAALERH